MLTSQQAAAKWARNTAGAQESLKAGVQNTQVAPTAVAAQRIDKYRNGVMSAIDSGRYAAALNASTLDDWKRGMLTKGIARIGQGVQEATPKFQAFMDRWLPFEQTLSDRIKSMVDDGTLASSIARSNFAITYNAGFSKRLIGS